MGFFSVTHNEESVKDYSGNGGNYLNNSGIYEVTIKRVIVETSPKGSKFLNLYIEYNNQAQMLYQAIRLTNNDGKPNLEASLFNKLAIVLGAAEGDEINDPVLESLPIGKGGELKECMVLEDFNDSPVLLRLQMEYSLYEGKIQERKHIRNFFRYTDKATASEIVNNSDSIGSQYEKELEFANKVTYKDDLTEEDIKEWKKNPNKEPTTTTTSNISFGKKRVFGSQS